MLHSFAILHGPTQDELVMMKTWIKDFVAFVNGDRRDNKN